MTCWKPDQTDNVQYGTADDGTALYGDILKPTNAGNGPWPGLVVCHGGGWKANTRINAGSLSLALSKERFVAFNIDFRQARGGALLTGQPAGVLAPKPSEDIRQAITYLRARSYVNSKVGIWGASSGGYQALYCTCTGSVGATRADACVALSGPCDLTVPSVADAFRYRKAVENYVGAPMAAQATKDVSPYWVVDATAKPIYMANSEAELVHADNLNNMETKLTSLPVTHLTHLFPGTRHGAALRTLAFKEAVAFLHTHLD